MMNPCYNCENRNVTCHNTCEDYKDYQSKRQKLNDSKKREKISYGYLYEKKKALSKKYGKDK